MARHLLAYAASVILAACGDTQPAPTRNQANAQETPAQPTAGQDGEMAGVLGMTMRQLRDAELVDPRGNDIGDVEGVQRDEGGTITHLLIEIEDSSPDRHVAISLDGLEAVPEGDDWIIRSRLTREELMRMEEAPR